MAAEEAGTIYADIRLKLNQLHADAAQANQTADALAKNFQAAGEKGGKLYVKGFGKGQQDINKKMNEFVFSAAVGGADRRGGVRETGRAGVPLGHGAKLYGGEINGGYYQLP